MKVYVGPWETGDLLWDSNFDEPVETGKIKKLLQLFI